MVLPLAFKLQGKSVLVIGAGKIGVGKASLLVDAGARVTIVAREQIADLPIGIEQFEERVIHWSTTKSSTKRTPKEFGSM
jgi:siroheme synthase (precorrin-2 oxidase/ferrochelatase)